MDSIKIIWEILNLNLKKYKVSEYENTKDWILIFWVEWKSTYETCPCCWIKTNKRQDLKKYKQKTTLKHINLSDKRIIEIRPIRRNFRCVNCKTHFLERFEFEWKLWYNTISFENYVISSFWYLSWNKIAELSKTTPWKIYNIIKNIDIAQINETWIRILEDLNEIYLWVDEHSFSWKDMILIITELKEKKLIAVLDWITKEKLESWINSLPLKIQIKVKWFSTDMNKWYAKSLKQIVWNPVHSVDKYHLFQEANRIVDDVRVLNAWLLKMNFVKAEDIVKLWKIPKKLQKEEIEEINKNSSNFNRMKKYARRKSSWGIKKQLYRD